MEWRKGRTKGRRKGRKGRRKGKDEWEMRWNEWEVRLHSPLSFPSHSLLLIYYKSSSSSWWWFICFSSFFLPVSFGKCTANLSTSVFPLVFFCFFFLFLLLCSYSTFSSMPLSIPENHQLILPVEIFPEKLVSISILFSVLLSKDENEGKRMWGREEGNWWVKRLTPFTFTHQKALQQLSGEQVLILHLSYCFLSSANNVHLFLPSLSISYYIERIFLTETTSSQVKKWENENWSEVEEWGENENMWVARLLAKKLFLLISASENFWE